MLLTTCIYCCRLAIYECILLRYKVINVNINLNIISSVNIKPTAFWKACSLASFWMNSLLKRSPVSHLTTLRNPWRLHQMHYPLHRTLAQLIFFHFLYKSCLVLWRVYFQAPSFILKKAECVLRCSVYTHVPPFPFWIYLCIDLLFISFFFCMYKALCNLVQFKCNVHVCRNKPISLLVVKKSHWRGFVYYIASLRTGSQ